MADGDLLYDSATGQLKFQVANDQLRYKSGAPEYYGPVKIKMTRDDGFVRDGTMTWLSNHFEYDFQSGRYARLFVGYGPLTGTQIIDWPDYLFSGSDTVDNITQRSIDGYHIGSGRIEDNGGWIDYEFGPDVW